jgi:hypothetical protein
MITRLNPTFKAAVGVIAVTALLAGLATRSYATIPVVDYAHISQSIQSQIANIAQYVNTARNTYQTSQQTAQQLAQFYTYLKMFGDPSKVAGMLGLGQEYQLFNGLRNARTIQDAMGAMNGAGSYAYTANGAFQPLAMVDQFGRTIQRDAQRYNPYSLAEQAFEGYRQQAEKTRSTQNALAQEYQNTLGQITRATSDAEVQKLAQKANAIKALMDANQAQLRNAQGQVDAAAQMLEVEKAKQAQAAMEEHVTERKSTTYPGIQTGDFNLSGGGTLPSGPAWLGQ